MRRYVISGWVAACTAAIVILIGCEKTTPTSNYSPITPTVPKPKSLPYFKANAGNDTTIYIPNTSVQLDASRSEDTGRTIIRFTWQKIISGQVAGPIWQGWRLEVCCLQEGVHIFALTVTSKAGDTSSDTIKVTVIDEFAKGIAPTASHDCDTVYRSDQENSHLLETGAFVDSAGLRYDLVSGFTFTQLNGPSTAKITPFPDRPSSALIENVVRGNYAFKVEIERKGLKVFDTLVLSLLPDTAKGKEYIFETTWKESTEIGYSGITTVADFLHGPGLLLGKTGREIMVWMADEVNTSWTEVYDQGWWWDVMEQTDPFYYQVGCNVGTRIVRQANKDKSAVGKKVKIKIKILK